MSEAQTFSLPEITNSEITALVKAGFYASKSDVAKDALRCLFEHRPHLKITAAIELYKSEKISLGKAAEIAEMSTADFKEELAARRIMRTVRSSRARVKKGIELIKSARR